MRKQRVIPAQTTFQIQTNQVFDLIIRLLDANNITSHLTKRIAG